MGEPTNDSPTHMASSRVEAGSGRWQVGVGTLGRGVVVVVVVMGMGMVMVVTVVVVRRAVIVCRLRRAVVVDKVMEVRAGAAEGRWAAATGKVAGTLVSTTR